MTKRLTGCLSRDPRPIFNPAKQTGSLKRQAAASLIELPPFSFGGVLRNSFTNVPLRTNAYKMAADFSVVTLNVTLVDLDTGVGPIFKIYQNVAVVYTSPRITATDTTLTTSLSLLTDDIVYVQVDDDGSGFAAGLTVMMR